MSQKNIDGGVSRRRLIQGAAAIGFLARLDNLMPPHWRACAPQVQRQTHQVSLCVHRSTSVHTQQAYARNALDRVVS